MCTSNYPFFFAYTGKKNSYKHEMPDKVANRQDGRFDLTWNRTIYHCSAQLKIGTFRTHASWMVYSLLCIHAWWQVICCWTCNSILLFKGQLDTKIHTNFSPDNASRRDRRYTPSLMSSNKFSTFMFFY